MHFGRGRRRLTAVDSVDLDLAETQTLGVVGESGSGKSTLARALVGLAPIAAGAVVLDGERLRVSRDGHVVDRRRRIQMIFQDPFSSLNPRMTVGDAIGEALGVRGGSVRAARAADVARQLELVHLDPQVASRLPSGLSGGQRQRVAIARALAARPEVLIADEITSSLDVSVQSAVLNLMRELSRELGISTIFVSHNLATVRYLSDRIAVMYLGRVVEVAETDALVSEPRHPYTRALLYAVPSLGGSVPADLELGDPPDPHDPPPGCHFHPRCPAGPRARPERTACVERDPREGAEQRPHRAFCHFASSAPDPRPEERVHAARDR
ncbi:MAG TPA: oligopeptide/dipeptide ABC transporter ATP-binding protein [Gaiellaceae bacterium]|nr:oligopeptide/dipeptide ABC transporter ATP-binding protein [Gaiellaceae bacterium]